MTVSNFRSQERRSTGADEEEDPEPDRHGPPAGRGAKSRLFLAMWDSYKAT